MGLPLVVIAFAVVNLVGGFYLLWYVNNRQHLRPEPVAVAGLVMISAALELAWQDAHRSAVSVWLPVDGRPAWRPTAWKSQCPCGRHIYDTIRENSLSRRSPASLVVNRDATQDRALAVNFA